ncbi:MAG: PhoH family protein, partial [Clostridia bacterium]
NIDMHTFKTILTRLGKNSKIIFLGDNEQIDMKKKDESCLSKITHIFNDSDIIGIINFEESECVRNPNIPIILNILKEHNY